MGLSLFISSSLPPLISKRSVQIFGLTVMCAGFKAEDLIRNCLIKFDRILDQSTPTNRISVLAKNVFTAIKANKITKRIGKYFLFYIPKNFMISCGFATLIHTTFLCGKSMNSCDFKLLSIAIQIAVLVYSTLDQQEDASKEFREKWGLG